MKALDIIPELWEIFNSNKDAKFNIHANKDQYVVRVKFNEESDYRQFENSDAKLLLLSLRKYISSRA